MGKENLAESGGRRTVENREPHIWTAEDAPSNYWGWKDQDWRVGDYLVHHTGVFKAHSYSMEALGNIRHLPYWRPAEEFEAWVVLNRVK